MRRAEEWIPTKFINRQGKWVGSRNTKHLARESRLIADATAAHYQRYLPRFAKGRLADLGCGTVPFYGLYRRYVNDVICVDWPNSPHDNPHLDLACDLNEQLPFHAESIDTIILSDVLEHIAEPQKLWNELHRVMRPKGLTILNVPFLYWVHEEPHDYYRYTEFALRRLAERSGFRVAVLVPIGGAVHTVADMIAKVVSGADLKNRVAAISIQQLARIASRTRPGKRLTLNTAARFPLGYFMAAEKLPRG